MEQPAVEVVQYHETTQNVREASHLVYRTVFQFKLCFFVQFDFALGIVPNLAALNAYSIFRDVSDCNLLTLLTLKPSDLDAGAKIKTL
jgi:hypothetical protein